MAQSLDAFYKENIGLVRKTAIKVYGRCLGAGLPIQYDDIEQETSIAFMKAYEGFDPDLGFKFSTYFTTTAYRALNKYIKENGGDDREVLGLFSMHAATNDDGDPLDMESVIEGDFDSPEEILEEKQLFDTILNSVSPLTTQVMEFAVTPPPELEEEYTAYRDTTREHSTIPLSFVCSFVERVTSATPAEMRIVREELQDVRRFLHERN